MTDRRSIARSFLANISLDRQVAVVPSTPPATTGNASNNAADNVEERATPTPTADPVQLGLAALIAATDVQPGVVQRGGSGTDAEVAYATVTNAAVTSAVSVTSATGGERAVMTEHHVLNATTKDVIPSTAATAQAVNTAPANLHHIPGARRRLQALHFLTNITFDSPVNSAAATASSTSPTSAESTGMPFVPIGSGIPLVRNIDHESSFARQAQRVHMLQRTVDTFHVDEGTAVDTVGATETDSAPFGHGAAPSDGVLGAEPGAALLAARLESTTTIDEQERARGAITPQRTGASSPVVIMQKGMKPTAKSKVRFHDDIARPRVFLIGAMGSPFATFSVIRFHDEKMKRKRAVLEEADTVLTLDAGVRRRSTTGASFAHLLQPTAIGAYDPTELDDPALKTGKHRTVIALPCYMGSIIQYARASDLKRELNDQFRQKHEAIDQTITLSKIRNLKSKLLEIAEEEDLEIMAIACAYVYLEKLILKKLVTKANRKLIGAVCLLLAVKVYDRKDIKYTPLMETIEKVLYVSPKQLREYEFIVFSQLDFDLVIPASEYMPHLDRILVTWSFNNFAEYAAYTSFNAATQAAAAAAQR